MYRELGAKMLFPLEEVQEEFHHTLCARKGYREFPINMRLPETNEKYTTYWPQFPDSIQDFFVQFNRNAPAEARLRLLSLLASE